MSSRDSKPKPLKILPRTVRRARAFLQGKGLRTSDVSPHDFAAAAAESDRSFADTLKMVAALQLGGQGQGPAPRAEKLAAAER